MSPWGSYPGISALLVPPSVRRTILSTWHPRNGELLGCPRLGWVATKFVSEGHPYDEGYFCEYDHDLAPEERFRVEVVQHSPEFDPDKAPKLDPEAWPEIRWLKGNHNYAVDYLEHVLLIMERLFGTLVAAQLIERGMRMLAVQYTADLARTVGVVGNDVGSICDLLAAILRSFGTEVELRRATNRIALTFRGFPPFEQIRSADIRTAVFAFFAMATRVLNGRVSITRDSGGSSDFRNMDPRRRKGVAMVKTDIDPKGLPALPMAAPFFSDKDTVASLLESCAANLPDHVVLRGAIDLTYAQLNKNVNQAAHGLAELGVGRGTHVAVMLGHTLDHIVTFFALMKLGAVQLPINVHLRGEGLRVHSRSWHAPVHDC